jgi:hypothetical protein
LALTDDLSDADLARELKRLSRALATQLQINSDFHINIVEDLILDTAIQKLMQVGPATLRLELKDLQVAQKLVAVLRAGLTLDSPFRVTSVQIDGDEKVLNTITEGI